MTQMTRVRPFSRPATAPFYGGTMRRTEKPPLLASEPVRPLTFACPITPHVPEELMANELTSSSTVTQLEPLLNASQVGELLNVNRRRVYELPIPQVRISIRCFRWRRSDIAAHVARSHWDQAG